MQERAEAQHIGEELLENDLIRQIKSTEPQPYKVSGEYLHVEIFDLLAQAHIGIFIQHI